VDIEQDAPNTWGEGVNAAIDAAPVEAAAVEPAEPAAPASILTEDDRAALSRAARAALENNGSGGLVDAANRTWFVGTDKVANHNTVLIRVARGEREHHVNISTAVFNDDAVSSALTTLDAAFAA
jgi:hypothetical protein